MVSIRDKREARAKRKKRVRKKIEGTSERPRLTVFKTARHVYAQIIDDSIGRTLVSASTVSKDLKKGKEKGISKVVFDRNSFIYHGRVKALAEAARENGLEF